MSAGSREELPGYTAQEIKSVLLAAGATGTIYSLVMPESEAALAQVVDGCDRTALLQSPGELDRARLESLFSRYHEPWTQKQDAMHEAYFERWLAWSAPIVSFRPEHFPFRYPTAGASEGIYKLMAEYVAERRQLGEKPVIHMFEGEYEGFPAYAEALKARVVRHPRDGWRGLPEKIEAGLFWISQPSAIDGAIWPDFDDFVALLAAERRGVRVIPDLTYVGSVARPFTINLDAPSIPAIVISHSKPFGGYYHRVGGVLSRREIPSLFGNKWFKNLLSLAWATEMMTRHDVFALPRMYRPVQEEAAARVAALLGLECLEPADVLLLGTALPRPPLTPVLESVLRGSPDERVIRLCLTPAMTSLIDPAMAPATAPRLAAAWASLEGSSR